MAGTSSRVATVLLTALVALSATTVATRPAAGQAAATETRLLHIAAQGDLAGGRYHVGPGETDLGTLTATGSAIPVPGTLTTSRSGPGLTWRGAGLASLSSARGVFAQVTISAGSLTTGARLLSIGGAVALSATDATHVRISTVAGSRSYRLPTAQLRSGVRFQTLGLAVEPGTDGHRAVRLLVGGVVQSHSVPVGRGRSLSSITWLPATSAHAYGLAVATFTGAVRGTLTVLAGLPCTTVSLAPANTISLQPSECLESLLSKASRVVPTPQQASWQSLQETAIIHFGVNTYTGLEYGTGRENPNIFNPSQLNTDQWAQTMKRDGIKLGVLVVKHHDGFLLYPSRYSKHGVASSSWRGGKGDVLRDFVTSMHKYGLKVGIYLSPADENQYANGTGSYANGSTPKPRTIPTLVAGDTRATAVRSGRLRTFHYTMDDYNTYFANQLYEVLTQYGPIEEVWLDGAQGRIPDDKVENYDVADWSKMIHSLQPNAVVAISGNDVRWVGNENGVARPNEWSVVPTIQTSPGVFGADAMDPNLGSAPELDADSSWITALHWWPSESDVPLASGWFWHPDQKVNAPTQLLAIYDHTVGRNSQLLLGISPDQAGLIPADEVAALDGMHQLVTKTYPTDLALHSVASTTGGSHAAAAVDGNSRTAWVADAPGAATLSLRLTQPQSVTSVMLKEDIRRGQQISSFVIEANIGGRWQQVASAGTVGAERIMLLKTPVAAQQWRVRIVSSRGRASLASFSLFRSTR